MRIGAQPTAHASYLGIPSVCAPSGYVVLACTTELGELVEEKYADLKHKLQGKNYEATYRSADDCRLRYDSIGWLQYGRRCRPGCYSGWACGDEFGR